MKLVFFGLLAGMILTNLSTSAEPAQDLEKTLARLVTMLPGEFDSVAQKATEEALGTPEELVHGRVNRSFTRIDAPDVGEHVFVATVRYGGRNGLFDSGEFQVWTLSVDPERDAIRMSPRRFKDPEPLIPTSRDAAAFPALRAADLLPPRGAAGCDISWQAAGEDLRGKTDQRFCRSMSSTLNQPLSWEWSFVLQPDTLFVSYAGRDETGELVNGRADQQPWRLDRIGEPAQR